MRDLAPEYAFGCSESATTSIKVIHVRFPPSTWPALTPTHSAKVFAPGYLFGPVNKPEVLGGLFFYAPYSERIATLAEGTSWVTIIETGLYVRLDSTVEAVDLISESSAARKGPNWFRNESAVQGDYP